MTSDDYNKYCCCIDCGRPVSKDGYPAFCDYHHNSMMRISEEVIKDIREGRVEPQTECSHCHNLSDIETSHFLGNITLCQSCFRNDRTL